MEHPVTTEIHGNFRIEIWPDSLDESPRGWDNLGTINSKHRSYRFEDSSEDVQDFYMDAENEEEIDPTSLNGKCEVFNRCGEKINIFILPIYLYDHSGITIRTSPFSCRWDSGCIGYIYCTEEKAKEERILTEEGEVDWNNVKERLEGEIKTLDQFITGDVYGFKVISINPITNEEEEIDSCWGFYGEKDALEEAIDNIPKIDMEGLLFDLSEAS